MLELLTKNSFDIITVIDRSGKLIYVNNAIERILGYTAAERTNKSILDLIHPDNVPEILEKLNNYHQKNIKIEFRSKHKDGHYLWFESIAQDYTNHPSINGIIINSRDITDRKVQQNQLKTFLRINEQSPSTIVITNPQGNITYVNPHFEKATGYTFNEVKNKNLRLLKSGKHSNAFYQNIWENITNGKHWFGEFYNKKKDGSYYWEQAHIFPILNKAGEILHFIKTSEDITHKKNTEEALIASESKLKAIIQALPDLLFHLDMHGNFLSFYQQNQNLYDDPENFIGKNIADIFDKDFAAQVMANISKTLKTGSAIHNYSLTMGTRKYFVANYQKLNNNEIIALIRDITDIKITEKNLQKSEEKFKAIVDNSSDGLIIVGKNKRFEYMSPSYKKMMGFDENTDPRTHEITQNIHPNDQITLIKNIARVIKIQEPSYEYKFRVKHKNGNYFWRHDKATILYQKNGKFKRAYVVCRDITRQMIHEKTIAQQKQALENALHTKNKFFNIIAHDLKSPFNAILGFSELLANKIDSYDSKRLKKIVDHMYLSSKNTYDLLENLLWWSRSQTNHISFTPEIINIDKTITNCVVQLKPTALKKNIAINTRIAHDLKVTADKNMLHTILRNLINNAIKFTNNNGTIHIFAHKKHHEIKISVTDNGIGINQEQIHRLFEIDSISSNPGTNNERGTGLGLLICKEFVEKHHGKIWIESQENVGSTFTFTIPIIRPE